MTSSTTSSYSIRLSGSTGASALCITTIGTSYSAAKAHLRVFEPGDVVQDVGAGLQRGAGDVGLPRVDGDQHVHLGEFLDHRGRRGRPPLRPGRRQPPDA